jgi:hypothetical protein
VLVTVVVGTFANFRLARIRNRFDQELAASKFEFDKEIATQKLDDERSARKEAKNLQIRLNHLKFQRETLLDLQQSTHSLLLNAGLIHRAKSKMAPDNGILKGLSADPDISERCRAEFARTALLISRVANEKIRTEIQSIKDFASAMLAAPTVKEGDDQYDLATIAMQKSLDEVGRIIRQLDQDEASEIAG